MSETYVKILQRVDTKENWEINNPILLDKEIGYERETGTDPRRGALRLRGEPHRPGAGRPAGQVSGQEG